MISYMNISKFTAIATIVLWPFSFLAQEKPELVVTNGHIASINCVSYHPGGKYIISGSDDHSIKIWDINLNQEFRTLHGHSDKIGNVVFSPDGKLIASIDRFEILIWEFPSGKILNRIRTKDFTTALSFTPDSKGIVTENEDDRLSLLDPFSGNILVNYDDNGPEHAVVNMKLGKIFGQCHECGDDNYAIAVFDIKTGKQEGLMKGPPFIANDLFVSPDGKSIGGVVNISGKMTVYVWDAVTYAIKGKIDIANNITIPHFIFNADGSKVICGSWDTKIRIFNVSDGKLVKEIKDFVDLTAFNPNAPSYKLGSGIFSLTLSPDGNTLGVGLCYNNKEPGRYPEQRNAIRLWNINTGKSTGEISSATRIIFHLYSPHSISGFVSANLNPEMGIKFWNLKDGSVSATEKVPGMVTASQTADTLLIYRGANVSVINVADEYKEIFSVPVKGHFGNGISPDGKLIALGAVDYTNGIKNSIQIWDITAKKLVKTINIDISETNHVILFSPDKKHIIICRDYDKLIAWEISTGKKVCNVELPPRGVFCYLGKEKGKIWIATPNEDVFVNEPSIVEMDYTNGSILSSFSPKNIKGDINMAAFSPDGKIMALAVGGAIFGSEFVIALYDAGTKEFITKLTGHNGEVTHVCFSGDGKTVYSASGDGTVKAWNITDYTERGTFIGMNDDGYIIFTPENYYKTSKGNYDGICFRLKGRLYTFEQFDLQFNRPDIVMAKLDAPKSLVLMYKLAWKKRVNRSGFTEEMMTGDLRLPELMIQGKDEIVSATDKDELKFKIKASDDTYTLDKILVYVNDVPVYGMGGISLKGKNLKQMEQEITIKLGSGQNLVQVFAVNEKGLESLKESFQIECKKPVTKPNLYILAVGVAKYKEKGHDLKYSTKDMNDFVAMMTSTGRFGKVVVKKLQDSMATRDNILKEKNMFKEAGIDDEVVIYFSCHGLLDEKLDYYLATHDVNFEDPSKLGFPYEELEKMMDLSPCRNRLVLIDACHSGEVDKDEVVVSNNTGNDVKIVQNTKGGGINIKPKAGLKNSFAYMQALFADVSKGSGSVVISAAAGAEFALESGEWNNGVFTYCILNGMKSMSADLNKDNAVSITELKDYVITNVSILTKGAQVPTVRKANYFNDFVVYKK